MVFLLVAGVGKLLDLGEFRTSLLGWNLIPSTMISFVSLFVPAFEVLLGGFWLIGIGRRAVAIAASCFVSVVTVAYCVEWVLLAPPKCSCLGLWSHYWAFRDSGLVNVSRNVMLLLTILPSIWSFRRKVGTSTRRFLLAGSAGGFTLLELLLVIAIVGILIALLLPSLVSVRADAERTRLRAKLVGHVAAFTAYTAEYHEHWPYLTDPKATYSILRSPPDIAIVVDYFQVYSLWHVPLSHRLYGKSWNDPVFRERRGDSSVVTTIWYSSAFLVDPKFFGYGTRTGIDQFRATRVAEVSFPSKKALFTCGGEFNDLKKKKRLLPMAFVDGSADILLDGQWRLGDPNGTIPFSLSSSPFQPGLHTWGGVRGRDRE